MSRVGLPSRLGGRIPGTSGSMPVSGEPPKPPVICAFYQDLAEGLPEPVFGQYPRGFLAKIQPWLRCKPTEVLHVCSGALRPGTGIRVDLRGAAKPDVIADGRQLPFAADSFAAALLDPPYTPQYARDLYGVDYPRPSHLLAEAARVVRPCGRIGFVHYIVPRPPQRCRLVKIMALSTGFGMPMRAVTIFEREQAGLFAPGEPKR